MTKRGDLGELCPGLSVGPSGGQRFAQYCGRAVCGLLLVVAIVAPVAFVAEAQAQEVQVRVYDREHRDYHKWDDQEDHAYRRYLAEQHREYREYNRQNHRRQREYWTWRHSHPD
jgi:type III secretory pathway component EscR